MKKLKWEFQKESKHWCAEYRTPDADFRISVYEYLKKKEYSLEVMGHHICAFKKLNNAKKVAQLINNG